jgi:hypothetical protein
VAELEARVFFCLSQSDPVNVQLVSVSCTGLYDLVLCSCPPASATNQRRRKLSATRPLTNHSLPAA